MSLMTKRNKKLPYHPCFDAAQVLDGVEQWVDGCVLVRETKGIPGFSTGRIDGLLVPMGWTAAIRRAKVQLGLIGIEVKISRGDFQRGLKSGQFERYAKALSGLYIATTGSVCKTSEVPREYGHLVVNRRHGYGTVCICKRHPKWRDGPLSVDDLWGVLFRVVQRIRTEAARDRAQYEAWKEVAGGMVVARMMQTFSQIEKDQRHEAAEKAGGDDA